MTAYLLDANVLIALSLAEHEHHERASQWLRTVERFAVCPVVEGALVRVVLRLGESPETATSMLRQLADHPRSEFWPDDLPYDRVDLSVLLGHRMVTDTYLAALAAHHGGILATLNAPLARRLPSSVELITAG